MVDFPWGYSWWRESRVVLRPPTQEQIVSSEDNEQGKQTGDKIGYSRKMVNVGGFRQRNVYITHVVCKSRYAGVTLCVSSVTEEGTRCKRVYSTCFCSINNPPVEYGGFQSRGYEWILSCVVSTWHFHRLSLKCVTAMRWSVIRERSYCYECIRIDVNIL